MIHQLTFRFFQFWVAFDQVLNTIFGTGWADETLSAGAYRTELKGAFWGRFWRPLIDGLFFWQDEHCKESHRSEMERRQSHPEAR